MNEYQKELQRLRPHDEIQGYECNERTKGYYFIPTASHGYLVVPKTDPFANIAKSIVDYGYEGKLAYYLEEDCEAGQFLRSITVLITLTEGGAS